MPRSKEVVPGHRVGQKVMSEQSPESEPTTLFDAEQEAAIDRLAGGAEELFSDAERPEEQRDAALDLWCTALAMEPNVTQPDVGYDSKGELCFDWSVNDGQETLHIAVEEDGIVTWCYSNDELDLEMTNHHGLNPEEGYQLFLWRFRNKAPVQGKHGRICEGPLCGTHGFVMGHRAEDGYVILESRQGIHLVKPEWVRS